MQVMCKLWQVCGKMHCLLSILEAWRLFVRATLGEYKEVMEYEILQDPSCLEVDTRVLKSLVIKASHV